MLREIFGLVKEEELVECQRRYKELRERFDEVKEEVVEEQEVMDRIKNAEKRIDKITNKIEVRVEDVEEFLDEQRRVAPFIQLSHDEERELRRLLRRVKKVVG